MKSLVTGGAGFIGSHLTEALLATGQEVVVLDDLTTGQLRNLSAVEGHPRLRFVQGSVLDPLSLEAAMAGCDQVYHMAAVLGVKLILEKPLEAMKVNLHGTENVLEAASRYGCQVMLSSSSEVYGKQTNKVLKEDDDRLYGPTTLSRWAYAGAKAMDEFLALAYHKQKGLPVVIVRFFNTVGPRQTGRYGMVLPSFVRQALSGQPITVYGSGEQKRSFTYVGDAVGAVLALMQHPRAAGEIFNIGSGQVTSILDLAEKVKAATGSDSPVQFVPYDQAYPPGFEDMQERTPDISKLAGLVGYRPRVLIDQIIHRVVDWFRTHDQ